MNCEKMIRHYLGIIDNVEIKKKEVENICLGEKNKKEQENL